MSVAQFPRSVRSRLVLSMALLVVGSIAPVFTQSGARSPVRTADPADARTAPLSDQVPVSPQVTVGRFDNGLRYYIRENQEPENRAELRLVVNVGSILEDDDQRGLAHFLEHMAFNGTEHFEKQELVRFMESIGMRLGPGINASTSFDETIYMLRLPTNDPQNLETAFQILEDWAHAMTLAVDEIDLERGVVIEEWRLGQGASSRIRDQQFPVLFRGSTYAERLPIGTLESLQTFEPEALRRFYRDWYRPGLMAVVAVGDFEAPAIEGLVREHFADLPRGNGTHVRELAPVPGHDDTLFSITTDPEVPATSVAVYHKLPVEMDTTIGGYRKSLVENLYNGMLNRRFAEIARQPDAPFLRASSAKGRLIRSSDVYALTAALLEGEVERGLEALLIEAARVARHGFTATELEREKTETLTGIERAYKNRESRNSNSFASEYIRAFLQNEPIPGIEYEYSLYQRFVPGISLEDVNAIGRDWITESNRVVLVTAPEKADLAVPQEADLRAALVAAGEAEVAPYVDTVSDAPLLSEIPDGAPVVATRTRTGGLTEWDLANGVTVVLKPTDFREDEVVMRAVSPGGTSLAPDEAHVAAATAATLIANGGVGEFNAIDLQKVLTGKTANVAPSIAEYEEGLRGSASPKDLETLLQLVYLRFTTPRADETFLQVFLTQMRTVLENRNANPETAFGDAYVRLTTQDHPRRRPLTVDQLEDVDLERSLAFYRDRFADASDFTFIFVGNFEPDAFRPLVERYLGALPSTDRRETWRDMGIRPPTGVVEETVRKGLAPRSQTRLAFTGPFEFDDQTQRTRIAAMAQTLETQLRDVMREQLGGTYSVGVGAAPDWRPEQSYTLTIAYGSDPERSEEMLETVFRVIAEFKASGPSTDDVRDTREALLRDYETRIEENNFWLGQLAATYGRGDGGAENLLTYPDTVKALTPEALQQAARQYLNTNNYVRVTLMPEGATAAQ